MSVSKVGNNSGHTIGSTFTATIGVVAHSAAALGNIAHAAEVLSGVVLQKSVNFAELSSATDEANLAITKHMLNSQIAELEKALPSGSKLKQLEL